MVVTEPALQVCRVKAGHKTAILQNPQFDWDVMAGGDDIMEGVFLGHGVIVGSLVLEQSRNNGVVKKQDKNTALNS